MRPHRAWLVLLTAVAAMMLLAACGAGPRPTATTAVKHYAGPPPMTIDTNKPYFATIETTMGDIKVQLDARDAPVTVNNFVFLARDHFYDNTPFHRIIKGFMIQGGDPTGTGTGGPGYQFKDELPKGNYDVGSVAMANSGPNTNGSQFFICEGDQCKGLPKQYSLFGQVVEGMDVVHKIAAVPVTLGAGGEPSVPTEDVRIKTIQITEQ
ncbi:MAG TPA: peptidylprolyl isomerase [Thermomicrobiales bacterium]|nr:peptidylprolyl isomerase [Thermomicrobiales bacterium]